MRKQKQVLVFFLESNIAAFFCENKALILGSLVDRVKQGPCLHIYNFSSGAELREMRQ